MILNVVWQTILNIKSNILYMKHFYRYHCLFLGISQDSYISFTFINSVFKFNFHTKRDNSELDAVDIFLSIQCFAASFIVL